MTEPGLDRPRSSASLDALDILVNNAGANFPGGRDEWEPDTFAAALALNLVGPMRLTTGCRPLLAASTLAGGASVINMVSLAVFRAIPIVPGYGSAKAGLAALTGNLAKQWNPEGIRVNAVAPGVIDTPDDRTHGRLPRAARRRARPHPDGPSRDTPTRSSAPCSSWPARPPATSPATRWSSTAATFSAEP